MTKTVQAATDIVMEYTTRLPMVTNKIMELESRLRNMEQTGKKHIEVKHVERQGDMTEEEAIMAARSSRNIHQRKTDDQPA